MPIYEFKCQSCDDEFELLMRASEKPKCPKCESLKLEKKLSMTAAPATQSKSLPICPTPATGGCGLPQCGGGGCQFD